MNVNELSSIARAVAVDCRVKIVEGEPKTDGQVIYLPLSQAAQLPPRVIHGYLDHEAAHCLFSDFDQVEGGIEGDVWNMVEDIRIEWMQMNRLPGSRANLGESAKHAFTRLTPREITSCSPRGMFLARVLRQSRRDLLSQTVELDDFIDPVESGSYAKILAPVLNMIHEALTPEASVSQKIAREIVRLMGTSEKGERVCDEKMAALGSEERKALKMSVSETLADEMKEKTQSEQSNCKLIEEPPSDRCVSNPDLSNQLERSISRMLVASDDLKIRRSTYRGRIHRRRLYRSVLPGNINVFERKILRKHIYESARVLICIDCSGSMSGNKSLLAAICTSAIATAVMRYPGARSAVLGFGLRNKSIQGLSILKDWHEEKRKMPIISNGSFTPTAEAVRYAEIMLNDLKTKNKKIVLVITDGVPDDVTKTRYEMNRIIDAGIKVGTCFILDMQNKASLPGAHVEVRNVEEMPNKIASLFAQCL